KLQKSPEARAREDLVNHSERLLCHVIGSETPLVLRLTPQDREIRLITNLELRRSMLSRAAGAKLKNTEDPDILYGIRCDYLDEMKNPIWRTTYWERTRKTRVRAPGELIDREEVFSGNPDFLPCDSRTTYLLVEEPVGRGARLLQLTVVSSTIDGTEADLRTMARAYRSVELSDEDAATRWYRLSDHRRAQLMQRVNLFPPDLVPDGDRARVLKRQWGRIPAEPIAGKDPETVNLYQTDFFDTYVPPRDDLRPSAMAGPTRALALNVVGPANLWIEIGQHRAVREHALLGADAKAGDAFRYTVRGVREDSVFLLREAELDVDSTGQPLTAAVHLAVPEGPATYILHPDTFRAHVRFHLDRTQRLHDLEVTPIVGRVGRGGSWWEARPDVRTVTYYDAFPEGEGPPILAEVVPQEGATATDVRIAARIPLTLEQVEEGDDAPFSLQVDFLGSDGNVLETRTLEGHAGLSPFDWLSRETELERLLSAPRTFLLRCSPEVRGLRVSSEEKVLVAFYSRLRSGGPITHVPEDYPLVPEIRANTVRRGRIRPRQWFYYRPSNQIELNAYGRTVRMHLQARLFEERPPSENTLAYSNLARALTLNDTRPDPVTPVRVWQRPSPREDRLVLATPADRYVAPTGRDTHIRVRDPLRPNDDDPQPVTLRLWRPQSDGELLAQVFLDGQPRHEALHAPGLSAIELGPVTAGDHVLRIELYVRSEPEGAFVPVTSATGPSPLLFANHPVTNAPGDKAAPGRLVHARTALPLRAGRSAS
ncbi:MAG: hypothetical protein ACYTFT_14230, partial [Planctomycetota bacterium]